MGLGTILGTGEEGDEGLGCLDDLSPQGDMGTDPCLAEGEDGSDIRVCMFTCSQCV